MDRPAPDGRPRYVIETRPATNEVVVGPAELLSRRRVEGTQLVLLADPEPLSDADGDADSAAGENPRGWRDAAVQVRAHGRPVPAHVRVDPTARTLIADLDEPLRGLAAGQSVVVYGGPGGERVLAQATVASGPGSAPGA